MNYCVACNKIIESPCEEVYDGYWAHPFHYECLERWKKKNPYKVFRKGGVKNDG